MKKQIRLAMLFLAAISSSLLGCRQPLAASGEKGAASSSSTKGCLTLAIEGAGSSDGAAKTIVPGVSGLIKQYAISLKQASPGTGSLSLTSATSPISIPGLADGSWAIEVLGQDSSGNTLAQGANSATVTNGAASATVNLAYIQSGTGKGGVDITLLFPKSTGIDSVDATFAGNAVAPAPSIIDAGDETSNKVVFTRQSVSVGSPLFRVFLKKAGVVMAGITESVWVFQNVTTSATMVLQERDFGAPPAAPTNLSVAPQHDGSLLLSWTNNSNVADCYVVRRSDSSHALAKITPTDDSFYGTGTGYSDPIAPAPSPTTYSYQVTARNRFGESTPASLEDATPYAQAAAPTFSRASGSVDESDSVTIGSPTSGATTIYYTTDGSDPLVSPTRISGTTVPLSVAPGAPLAIKAVAGGALLANSATAAASYNRRPRISSFTEDGLAMFNSTLAGAAAEKNFAVVASDLDGDALSYSYSYSLIAFDGTTSAGTAATGTIAPGASPATCKYSTGTSASGGYATARASVSDGQGGVAYKDLTFKVCGWRQLASIGAPPTPRGGYSSIVDSQGNMYVLGGRDNVTGYLSDLYKYNIPTQTWTALSIGSSPPARYEASAVYYRNATTGADHIILSGGYNGSACLCDSYDLTVPGSGSPSWSANHPYTTAAYGTSNYYLSGQSAIYDGTSVIAFGGLKYGYSFWDTTLKYYTPSATTPAWAMLTAYQGTAPSGRYGHSAIFDGASMYIFGGSSSAGLNNDLYKLTNITWSPIATTSPPPARTTHAAIYYGKGADKFMVIFGGGGASATYLKDAWRLNLATAAWEQLPSLNGPTGRQHTGAVLYNDGQGSNMVVFGGELPTSFVNDVWEYVLP